MANDFRTKRYELDNTSSINNLRNNFNDYLKKLDWVGYTNLIKNCSLKTRVLRDKSPLTYGLSRWTDDTEGDDFIVYGSNVATELTWDNDHTALPTLTTAEQIYQKFYFTELEKFSNNGILTLTVFFVSPSGKPGISATLQQRTADGANWGAWADLSSSYIYNTYNPQKIAGDFSSADYYSGADFSLYEKTTLYNLYALKSPTSDDTEVTLGNVQYRVKLYSSLVSSGKENYILNVLSYFGSTDSASFVKNADEEDSHIYYDEDLGDWFITTDGSDKVSLSSGKYLITVGARGTYSTLYDAIDSIGDDASELAGDSRIIFFTSDTTETANITMPTNITVYGNGYSVNLADKYITLNNNNSFENLNFNNTGTGYLLIANGKSRIKIENSTINGVAVGASTSPFVSLTDVTDSDFKNITIYNKADTYNRENLIIMSGCQKVNMYIYEMKSFGIISGATIVGSGIYIENSVTNNSVFNNITILKVELEGTITAYTTDTLYVIDCQGSEYSNFRIDSEI